VTGVIKTALQPYLSNRQVGVAKHIGGLLNAIVIYIIHGRLLGNGIKKSAKILGIHTDDPG